MLTMNAIYSVPEAGRVSFEQLGTKPKFWFTRDSDLWLFKQEHRDTGEDWAEVFVAEICALLEVPHAIYELAIDPYSPNGEARGVVTKNLRKAGEELIHGNTLLGSLFGDYPEQRSYRVSEYTIEAVFHVISTLNAYNQGQPHQENYPTTALDAFAGYLMIDALTGNQDRHHENWGAIRNRYIDMLAPTYDHGASCARNLSDEQRTDRLTTSDQGYSVQKFASRAKSAFYSSESNSKRLSTHEAYSQFCVSARIDQSIWIDKLLKVTDEALLTILDDIPETRMSQVSKQFTLQYIQANRSLLQSL